MDTLEQFFEGHGRTFKRIRYGGDTDVADLDVHIFPVLGNDRIPDAVEHWLKFDALKSTSHLVCVSGDFTIGETPVSRVSTEADRILSARGSCSVLKPLLIDTPLADGWEQRLHTNILQGTIRELDSILHINSNVQPDTHLYIEDFLAEHFGMLKKMPAVELWPDGQCRSLAFTDSQPYPRSVLSGISEGVRSQVFQTINSFSKIESLSFAYADLEYLPSSLPHSLVEFDITGNPISNFECLNSLPNLRSLNIAACNLSQLPEQIVSLQSLHTMIAAKNRLSTIPEWISSIPTLRRITLYRNQLSRLDTGLTQLQDLRILNIGASPVSNINAVADAFQELQGLGICMTSLTDLPDELFSLPKIQRIDISKNPQLSCTHLPKQHLSKLANSMLDWNSVGTHKMPEQVS
ncbi:MAG: leucine-rich repeat domain-containing protein [Phycisphaerales bacterium]